MTATIGDQRQGIYSFLEVAELYLPEIMAKMTKDEK